jgi:5,10-methylenetetrahydromethanopterin reductase
MRAGVIMPPLPRRSAELARTAEALGFASMLYPDSQNLAPDVWQQLALAAQATTTIHLGPGVTNPLTRDPAVTAGAALTLQVESGGRAICGVGRGDSSLQRIGKTTVTIAEFERWLVTVQAYLGGATVERNGFTSRLEWLRAVEVAKVPVGVAATGPRAIAVAARHAERIAFAVGADPERIGWALETARAAAREAGRDPASIRYGAYLNCAVHPDLAVARDAVRGTVATFARFSSIAGASLDHLPPRLREVAARLRTHYDMRVHTRAKAEHARTLEDEFIDWFAIAGPLEIALPRFQRLAALGLDFCHVVPGSGELRRDVAATILQSIATEVVPVLHAADVPPDASRAERLRERLRRGLDAVHVDVHDESEAHAGHPGAAGGAGHYQVVVVSARFEGRAALARHRLVYEAVGDLLPVEVHALAITAYTPDEWRRRPS